jgi:putative ABC transport system ATP-binding protein
VTGPTHIVLEAVSRHYATPAGPVQALKGIDLEVEPGQSLAITGPSGCGKSTLLGLIGGLETPSSGRVWLDSREISSLSERERARLRREELGLLFQTDNLQPFLTAVENVGLQLSLHGPNGRYERCRQTLAELGLAAQADKLPDRLSGGERQRAAIARALIHRPRLVLADEPTGSLDADNSALVIDLLLAAQREMGATLVVVTHDAHVAARMDRTVAFRDGRLVEKAASADAG